MASITGTSGSDYLNGGVEDDLIIGDAGQDQIFGRAGNDNINGGPDNDYISGGPGNDTIDGGTGLDSANYVDASGPVILNLTLGTVTGAGIGTDTLVNIEWIQGSDYSDILIGDANDNILNGFAGNDTIDGGAGSDTAGAFGSTGSVTLDLTLGTATGAGIGTDTLINIENISGSQYADNLIGDGNRNKLSGGLGNDTLTGGAGSDTFQFPTRSDDISVDTITDFTAGEGGDNLNILTFLFSNYPSPANPFASGHARLVQSGADTLFQLDFDGAGSASSFQTLAILKNVNKSDLVASNFGGFSPNPILSSALADTLNGTPGADDVDGLAGNDTINGLAGNDNLRGGTGDDVINGDAGNDQLYGNDGNDNISGGADEDILHGGEGNDTLDGGSGQDYAYYSSATGPVSVNLTLGTATGAGGGSDTLINIEHLYGSQHADTLVGDANANYFTGSAGNDTINGGAGSDLAYYHDATGAVTVNLALGSATGAGVGSDTLIAIENIYGSPYVDNLTGDSNANLLIGGADNDILLGGSGNDTLNGGAGSDFAFYLDATGPVSVNLALGTASGSGIGTDTLIDIENILGSQYGDTIIGDANANNIRGEAGNDTLTGGAGSDYFQIRGSSVGVDFSVDTITDFAPGAGGDNLLMPTLQLSNYTTGVNPFVSGHARLVQSGADTLLEFDLDGVGSANSFEAITILKNVTKENMVASNLSGFSPVVLPSPGADLLLGGVGDDVIDGLAGNDTLTGLAGNDKISGGAGDDVINGDEGRDELYGNAGNDSISGGAGFDLLYGGDGNDTLNGGVDTDIAYYRDATGPVTVNLALGTATGSGVGSDTLIGIEHISGSQYADTLVGDANRNTLFGELGNDTLTGGAGSDIYYVNYISTDTSVDTITDFSVGASGDSLASLSFFLTNFPSGSNPFASGHARLTQSGADTLLETDKDGVGGSASFQTIAILQNVTKSDLVASNLGGFNPNAIQGSALADTLAGSIGNDEIDGLAGNDTISGLGGNDVLKGGTGDDLINGDEGNDTLYGNAGDDSISGGAGVNIFYGGEGNDTLDGSLGLFFDFVDYRTASGPVNVNLALGAATGEGSDTLINIENIYGSEYGDTLVGDANGNNLYGGSGNDTLTGGGGNDFFRPRINSTDTSIDTITDFIVGARLNADKLVISSVGLTNFTDGTNPFASSHARLTQLGPDTLLELDLDGVTGPASFQTIAILKNVTKSSLVANNLADQTLRSLNPNAIQGSVLADTLTGSIVDDDIDALAGNDTVSGLAGNDKLSGGTGDDVINGDEGNDQLYGNAGNDSINGGTGSDNLTGGDGNDTLNGGADSDRAIYEDATGPVTVNLALGTATGAGVGSDTLISIENISGSAFADILIGDGNVNNIAGGLGNDTLTGGAGTDFYQLINISNDTSVDTITDFSAGAGGDSLFIPTFILTNFPSGTNPFASGHARLTQSGADTLMELDKDGAVGSAAFQPMAILKNVNKSDLVASNLGGFNPGAIGGSAAADAVSGGDGNDEIDGLEGNDTVNGRAGNDKLSGGTGDDIVIGGAGNDTIDGGSGVDRADFSGNLASFTLSKTGNTFTVRSKLGTDGTDTLTNVESVKFADKTINLTIQAKAAAAPQADVIRLTELYVAFFNRVPDADGLAYWIDQKVAGQSISQIADVFYSAGVQYSSLTGFSSSMTNADFVNVIYRNVLGRPDGADAGGLAYWSDQLASGTATRGSLVSTILDSAHTFKGDATYGFVADLLDNKYAVAKTFAIDLGLNYNTPADSITQGMAISAAVTSNSTTEAIALIGITPNDVQLI